MINLEKIKSIYKFSRELTLSDIQVILQATTTKSFAPSEYLIQEGGIQREIFFITKGLARSFAVNDKGDEITIGLFWENQPLASTDIIIFNQPSRHYFQALEPTKVLSINYDLLQDILRKHPKLIENRKILFQKILKRAQDRIESFVLYSPEERYLRFVEEYPDIINRVPNKYIANVLGITPVSLSRIRSRLASKKK